MENKELYHVTTPKKAKRYKESGKIIKPVRGFDTLLAAMYWAMRTGRTVIYVFQTDKAYKLPDHHNEFGNAYWVDEDVENYKCVVSTN